MLRTIFVLVIILFGGFYAVQSPFYFLLFYLWYAYFRPDAWIYWLDWVQQLNLSLFIGIGVLITTAASTPRLRGGLPVGLMFLFLGHTLVSTIFSPHPDVSWSAWFTFIRVLLISYAIVLLVTDLDRFRLAVLVIALSLGFEGAKQGWVGFVLNPGGSNANTLPFLGDNNGVAVGMMMLVPVFAALTETASSLSEKTLYRIFGIGVFLRGISTYSRGGFLSALVLAAMYLWNSQHKVRTLVGILVISTVVGSVMPQQFWDRMHTITAPSTERDESARGRVHFWEVATVMAAANPILGVGFDGFEASYNQYDTSGGQFGGDRAVHSTWFGVIADTGYVGGAIFGSLFLVTLSALIRLRKARDSTPSAVHIAIFSRALIASLMAFAVGGTFVNLQYNEMFWHFIALGVALKAIAEQIPSKAAVTMGVLRRPAYDWYSSSPTA